MGERSVVTNIYNPKVKVTGWDQSDSAPKDNDPYNSTKKNYFLSTHKRLGGDDSKIPISTTREMQEEAIVNNKILKIYRQQKSRGGQYFRDSCPYIMREGTGVHPMDYFAMDYTTTTNYDYRHPNPHMEKPFEPDLSMPPTTYRRIYFCGKPGVSKFLDDVTNTTVKCLDKRGPPPYVYIDTWNEEIGNINETRNSLSSEKHDEVIK